MSRYDYLIVGAGLFGSVFACEAKKAHKTCLVIDKRPHIGGNVYTENIEGINVHRYGAHIFHTGNKEVWDYVNSIVSFNRYTNSPLARYKDELYNLPFNMNTFHQMWGVVTPSEAREKIDEQKREAVEKMRSEGVSEPRNLKEQALSLVGRDIYEKLVEGYTEKQWGRRAEELPAFIIKRLPVRFIYDNNYFNDAYQGIPVGGYTGLVKKLLEGVEVRTGTDYFSDRAGFDSLSDKTVFTGMIDEFYDYRFGELEYRSLRFETEILDTPDFQGNAVVNYTEYEIPYTRIIEHKHFEFGDQEKTVITREYPAAWKRGDEPYYPVNDEKNSALYQKYRELADREDKVIFGGRLGQYRYFDMHQVVESALMLARREFGQENP
ncbi:MAG: UDP-galactopyranose mutase [Lachnospiraceae bacterium]|nr:UDP-galactopyranose mutase [Lachnospiraceae bacterium]